MKCAIRSLLVFAIALVPRNVHAQTESVEYYGTDAVGSIRITFDVAGNVIGRMDYGPFGQQLLPADAMPRERFGGNTIDGESDQAYFHARQYQARLGRFGQVDPVFNALQEPQRWNRYTFTIGNPVTYSDPTGRDPFRNVPCIGCQIPRSGAKFKSGTSGRADDFLNADTIVDGGTISIMNVGTFEREGRISGRDVKQRRNETGKNERLNDDQCNAIRTVLQREQRFGTQAAAARSSDTFGDHTIHPFNSDNVPNIDTPVGELDVDWFTDLQGERFSMPNMPVAVGYSIAKLAWSATRYLGGWQVGHWAPFSDPGERTAVSQASAGTAYSEIFTPEYMAKACPR